MLPSTELFFDIKPMVGSYKKQILNLNGFYCLDDMYLNKEHLLNDMPWGKSLWGLSISKTAFNSCYLILHVSLRLEGECILCLEYQEVCQETYDK